MTEKKLPVGEKALEVNPFGDGFKESTAGEFVKWSKIGQQIKGIFVESYNTMSELTGKPAIIYILENEAGEPFRIGSRGKFFDMAMRKIVSGQWVGFLYHSDIPSKKKGFNAMKLVKIYPGTIDPVWVERNVLHEHAEVDEAIENIAK